MYPLCISLRTRYRALSGYFGTRLFCGLRCSGLRPGSGPVLSTVTVTVTDTERIQSQIHIVVVVVVVVVKVQSKVQSKVQMYEQRYTLLSYGKGPRTRIRAIPLEIHVFCISPGPKWKTWKTQRKAIARRIPAHMPELASHALFIHSNTSAPPDRFPAGIADHSPTCRLRRPNIVPP